LLEAIIVVVFPSVPVEKIKTVLKIIQTGKGEKFTGTVRLVNIHRKSQKIKKDRK
jgi:hypothetical protein